MTKSKLGSVPARTTGVGGVILSGFARAGQRVIGCFASTEGLVLPLLANYN
jgi:hypothetical protein